MDVARDLLGLAWRAKRQFEQLSDNTGEARLTLAKLDSAASLCRLIYATPGKRLWEDTAGDLESLRDAVERAGTVAEVALPLKNADWLTSARARARVQARGVVAAVGVSSLRRTLTNMGHLQRASCYGLASSSCAPFLTEKRRDVGRQSCRRQTVGSRSS